MRFLNIVLGIAVFCTAIWLYYVKYDVRASVRRIEALQRQIEAAEHDVDLLKAEWTYLNRPDRLQLLSEHHLELSVVTREQVISEDEIASTIPERAAPEVAADAEDPIADLLGAPR